MPEHAPVRTPIETPTRAPEADPDHERRMDPARLCPEQKERLTRELDPLLP